MDKQITIRSLVTRIAGRLRFPRLLLVTAILFVIDLLVPDAIPFADEILLGLITLVLSSIPSRSQGTGPGGSGSRGPRVRRDS